MGDIWPRAYSCYNNNYSIRMDSTSGGIFTAIATFFIEKYNAVVYGAAFDESFHVVHVECDNINDLAKLRGSKYPQSYIGDTYRSILKRLEKGKVVLFCGTPCQVAALNSFLRKEYDSLYTIDFICHGVASPKTWDEYISEFQKEKGAIKRIIFKYKYHGWKKWYFYIETEKGVYRARGTMAPFMRSYLQYVNIRPSCYECRFKGLSRKSDFTIGDCWGIGELDNEMNDDKGLSSLLINNDRAAYVFEELKKGITYKEYDSKKLMEKNWTTFKCVPRPHIRDDFFFMVDNLGADKAISKMFRPSLKDYAAYYANRISGKEK